MVNLSALGDISPLVFNNTIINDSTTMIPNMAANTNNLSGDYWGLMVMVAAFVIIFWKVYKQTGDTRLDLARSTLFSSGIAFCIGLLGLVSNLFSNYIHVIWFFNLFVITVLWLYFLKKKGL